MIDDYFATVTQQIVELDETKPRLIELRCHLEGETSDLKKKLLSHPRVQQNISNARKYFPSKLPVIYFEPKMTKGGEARLSELMRNVKSSTVSSANIEQNIGTREEDALCSPSQVSFQFGDFSGIEYCAPESTENSFLGSPKIGRDIGDETLPWKNYFN